jgi:hypothetical protein
MTDTLPPLPCPFCGGAPYRREVIEHYPADSDAPAGSYSAWFNIGCDACGVEIGEEYESTVIELWNRRAALPAAQPGYKLMPIEPTMAMSTAFHSARPQTAVEEPDGSWTANAWDCFRASYAAMLYAAVAAQPVTDGVGLVDGNTSSSHTPLKG